MEKEIADYFDGIFIKRKYSQTFSKQGIRLKDDDPHIFKDITKKYVYCILMVGERDSIKGIETLFSSVAKKVQPEAFGVEVGTLKDFTQR